MTKFKELLQASFKSNDTEEWLDVHFTRPIGLVFALLWNRFDVHPNVITILSIFLGVGAGVMFGYTDLVHNIMGVVLLMFANFCDSTDGQMARLTGKKTLIGRMLDGFSGDVWFFAIYVAISIRLMTQNIPGTETTWGMWSWVLCVVAGILCHSPQSSLADYYRQIHLFFLKGKDGSELDNSAQQKEILNNLPKKRFFALWKEKSADMDASKREALREEFLASSRKLMPYTNLLTFNLRAIVVYVSCLLNIPWAYPLFEIVVLTMMYVYMHKSHEELSDRISRKL